MKESFPLPNFSGVVESVEEWLNGEPEEYKIPGLSPRTIAVKEPKEIAESQDLRKQLMPFPPTENIVKRAEEIIANYQNRSLNALLNYVGLNMPRFKKLFIVKYNEDKDKSEDRTTIWYGLTHDLKLNRYYYSPSTSKLIIVQGTPFWRIHELIAFLKLPNESIVNGYGEDQLSSQIKIIANGFNLPEETVKKIVSNMPEEEVRTEYMVNESALLERKSEKVTA